jgi:putative NADPH-quinone reductase
MLYYNNKNMIINFHPQEIESKKGKEIIEGLVASNAQEVFHATDKTAEEWKAIISTDEKLILVAPTYWWGFSYEFDKWIQGVLSYDYAFRYNEQGMPEGLLNGRAFELHTTQGTPEAYATVMRANMKQRLETGIFGFCGAKVDAIFHEA